MGFKFLHVFKILRFLQTYNVFLNALSFFLVFNYQTSQKYIFQNLALGLSGVPFQLPWD